MLPRLALTLAFALYACLPAFAQSSQPDPEATPAHVSLVEGTASIEREGRSESPLNMPLLSGDRLKTADGRVEVLFADGSALHLDRSTTLDVQSDDLARLIDGRVRLNILGRGRTVGYRIDSPSGSVLLTQAGEYRVAILRSPNETQLELAVIRGAGDIFTEQGTTTVRAGERAYASAGLAPSYAYSYNSANWDAFDRWSEGRRDTRLGVSSQYLPSELQTYSTTFDEHGDWRYAQPYGYVWYPRVAASWRPYYYGRWMSYPRYGWTWVGVDRFSWPTHHYGRWGFSANTWFWIPARHWAPHYVSWAYAGNYVSWCPLGFNNRPLIAINIFNGPHYRHHYGGWTTVSRGHFSNGWVHHRAVDWGRNRRPHFQLAQAAPINPNVAVPRGSAPVRWAGTRSLDGGSRALSSDGTRAVPRGSGASSRDSLVSPGGSRAVAGDSGVRAVPRGNSAAARDPLVSSGGSRAVANDSGARAVPRGNNASARDSSLPPSGEGRGVANDSGGRAVPRYVNRGDEIIRSQTERPSARVRESAGVNPRVPAPGATAVPRAQQTFPQRPAGVAPPAGSSIAVPRGSTGRTIPAGPARRVDDFAQPAGRPSIDRAPQAIGRTPSIDRRADAPAPQRTFGGARSYDGGVAQPRAIDRTPGAAPAIQSPAYHPRGGSDVRGGNGPGSRAPQATMRESAPGAPRASDRSGARAPSPSAPAAGPSRGATGTAVPRRGGRGGA